MIRLLDGLIWSTTAAERDVYHFSLLDFGRLQVFHVTFKRPSKRYIVYIYIVTNSFPKNDPTWPNMTFIYKFSRLLNSYFFHRSERCKTVQFFLLLASRGAVTLGSTKPDLLSFRHLFHRKFKYSLNNRWWFQILYLLLSSHKLGN